jgi:hypothetical protein
MRDSQIERSLLDPLMDLLRQMMRMLRSDWQTKVTAHAHHLPLKHQGSSQENDAIFGLPT